MRFWFLLLVACSSVVHAQPRATIADSLWCDHLNEIIKCASLDEITDRVGQGSQEESLKPLISLAIPSSELVSIKYNKFTYEGICTVSKKQDKLLLSLYDKWNNKVKKCLQLWELNRLPNQDKTLNVWQDYFYTNSEDETTVRLDIVRVKDQYGVRLRIY